MILEQSIRGVLEAARRLGNIDKNYRIGKFNDIRLPADHLLPAYQQQHALYDRFLPCLADLLPAGSTVIDVGANCGDTLAAMASANSGLHYICIEPDPDFYDYLVENLARMKHVDPLVRATTIRALIGKQIGKVSLTGKGGTKHAQTVDLVDNVYVPTVLDDAVNLTDSQVSLLKSDVDGYDFDVLRSGGECISRNQPLIYFECDYENATQLASYHDVVEWLSKLHYNDWVVFDNFGGFVMRDSSPGAVHQLFDYVWRQKTGSSTRTMFYVDLLAVPASHQRTVDRALANYSGLKPASTRSIT